MTPVPDRQWAFEADTSSPAHCSPGEPASILALSSGCPVPGIRGKNVGSGSGDSGGGWASGLKRLGRDGDKKAAALAVAMAGLAAVGLCAAFVYCHPTGKSWRKSLCCAKKPSVKSGSGKNLEADFDIKAAANDRALKTLGVRELHLGHLPLGAEIINLPDQVGGHKTMKSGQKTMKEVPALLQMVWKDKGSTGRFILKILHDGGRGLVELGFYEKLEAHVDGPGAKGVEPERTELESFVCPYYGAVKVSTDGYISDDGNIVEGTTTLFLVIEDLCAGFDSSCVLDVKMGRTTVEPGEREAKKTGQMRKYPNQPVVGFRFVGMRWSSFYEGGEKPQIVTKAKEWGAELPVEETAAGLAMFFHDGTHLRRGRVINALKKVRRIMDWFTTQKIFKFYASSLLLTYDAADPEPEGDGSVEEDVMEVRMIDFAHAVPIDGEGEDGTGPATAPGDTGYLYGLSNLVGIMEELLRVTEGSDPPVILEDISRNLTFMSKVKKDYVPKV